MPDSERVDREADIPQLSIVHGGAGCDAVGKRSTKIEQLVQHGAVEVTRHAIAAEKHFYLDAVSDWAGFEFVYVLAGRLQFEMGNAIIELKEGDFFFHHGLSSRAFFRVSADAELLMVSTPPSYHLIREEIQVMMNLAREVDARDQSIEGHLDRLERLAVAIGERLGLEGQRLIDLSYAAYLHDIGKAQIDSHILLKAGNLTPEERAVVQQHVIYGHDMLVDQMFLGEAATIVAAHHENYDGTGYPNGLAGDDIPIEARVIRIADTYDAMTTVRVYQPARANSDAIRAISDGAGTLFDPHIVRVFLELLSDAH